MQDRPNLLFLFADQLRAASLPMYGETQIETPHLTRLAQESTLFTNAISTSPMCTPYRSMLVTGRHPQTTGLLINSIRLRHDEIGIGDAFSAAGYRTGWVGKWHLHTGSWPENNARDFVPRGRDRMGFQYWRTYNMHMTFFDGPVHLDNWDYERWEGYETKALNRYAIDFMDSCGEEPFCLFVSPHPPHFTPGKFAPDEYYERLPKHLTVPDNVPEPMRQRAAEQYRHYLAMTLAIDDMVGELLEYLERAGKLDRTILVFTSDHGTQMGAQGVAPWAKKMPYEESINVPLMVRWPGVIPAGVSCDSLVAPVDFFPTLCGLCGIPYPQTVEGFDLSETWKGGKSAHEQEAVLTTNFSETHDYLVNGNEWRGVRTKEYSYARWLSGKVVLYDLRNDPLQLRNLADEPSARSLREQAERTLERLMAERGDALVPSESYADWYDNQRRVIRNAFGPLPHPESEPDWSFAS